MVSNLSASHATESNVGSIPLVLLGRPARADLHCVSAFLTFAGKGVSGDDGQTLSVRSADVFRAAAASQKEIVPTPSASRATVRKLVDGEATELSYERGVQPAPKLANRLRS